MISRIVSAIGVLLALSATSAFAQPRVEVSGFAGWTLSDGVDGPAILAGDGNVYDRVDPDDSVSFGFDVGAFLTENVEVGFLYGRQNSTMLIANGSEREVGDLNITTYHGYFAYNFGASDAVMRPFVYGGLGATNFGSVDFSTPLRSGTIGGRTQFSSTWGGGVKIYPAPHVGVRAAVGFTPTYIKTDDVGWWCDPFWGCYVVGDAQYSNQLTFSGGVTVRF